ncbi:MAG: hypothetical protein ISN29_12610 [Gammaproteobacteria bacterium AqS3]|nr:hypothetical protein [Gammaproteobacteria bacterium AqS3]
MSRADIYVFLICEDDLTEAVIGKMLQQTGRGFFIIKSVRWNKSKIQREISNLNHSAKGSMLNLVVTDQDTPGNCPAGALENLGAPLAPNLLYRFAVMEVESWVMADRENFSEFFSVRINALPQHPDEVINPKEHLAGLIRKFGSKNIDQAGRGYNPILGEFVGNCWNVSNAQKYSPSLKRTYQRLQNHQLHLSGG